MASTRVMTARIAELESANASLEGQITLNVDYSKQVANLEAEIQRLRFITNPGDAAAHEEREALHEHAIASKDARIRELEAKIAKAASPDSLFP